MEARSRFPSIPHVCCFDCAALKLANGIKHDKTHFGTFDAVTQTKQFPLPRASAIWRDVVPKVNGNPYCQMQQPQCGKGQTAGWYWCTILFVKREREKIETWTCDSWTQQIFTCLRTCQGHERATYCWCWQRYPQLASVAEKAASDIMLLK